MKEICRICNGKRYIKDRYFLTEYDRLCYNCCGTGKVESWIDNIFPKERDLYLWKKVKVVNTTDTIIDLSMFDSCLLLHPDTPKDIPSVKLYDRLFGNKFISSLVEEEKIYFYEVYCYERSMF